ncbi:hypothetical protein BDP55DRAFT_628500 [Colletotrichum godetiae]|uniref:Uncharacterized protein n=1 Tax=Colletotrichum godetiae TaxID=1209918 RepID=A0AAJ0AVX7_9PEZI|nr:uncharacterized protein BDP55DRAFT_628500 [Colletotrichum godetiae]KAK1689971.1 hypothetical protein BDP55DRAFT_628500 [Colletotrichum godetiae]
MVMMVVVMVVVVMVVVVMVVVTHHHLATSRETSIDVGICMSLPPTPTGPGGKRKEEQLCPGKAAAFVGIRYWAKKYCWGLSWIAPTPAAPLEVGGHPTGTWTRPPHGGNDAAFSSQCPYRARTYCVP